MAYVKLNGHNGTSCFNSKTTAFSVRKPYVTPLPYHRTFLKERNGKAQYDLQPNHRVKRGDYVGPSVETLLSYCRNDSFGNPIARTNQIRTVHNNALEKLDTKLEVANNFFESWYERKQAYDLAYKAGKQVLNFLKNWKKRKFWDSLKTGAKRPESLPEAWLIYQFGIVPLVGDIDTALRGLGHPLIWRTYSATSGSNFSGKIDRSFTVWYEGTYRKTIGCSVKCNPNPNTHLLNLGGFTTPLSTTWSVLPWGWAVDYFVNVSQMLSNIEVKHPGVTCYDWWESEKDEYNYHGYTTFSGWTGLEKPWTYVRDGRMSSLDGTLMNFRRKPISRANFKLVYSFPLLGSNKVPNLFSAIALTMKGKKR